MLSILLLAATAFAQDSTPPAPTLNSQTLLLPTSGTGLTLHDPSGIDPTAFTWRTSLSYTHHPLEYRDFYGTNSTVVGQITQLNYGVAKQLGPMRLGLDVPLAFASGGPGATGLGLGSVRLDGQVAVAKGNVPAALFAALHLPNGGAAGPSMTAPLAGSFGAVGAGNLSQNLVATAEIGVIAQPADDIDGAESGSRLRGGLGLQWRRDSTMPVIAEWIAEPQLASFGQMGSELLLATEMPVGTKGAYTVRPAFIAGLTNSVGTPNFRFLVQAKRQATIDLDPDGDGILGKDDQCPQNPEDMDAYQDTDGCPEDTVVTLLVVDADGNQRSEHPWTVGDLSANVGASLTLPAGPATIAWGQQQSTLDIPVGPPVTLTLEVKALRGSLLVTVQNQQGEAIPGATWSATGPTSLNDQAAGNSAPVRPGNYVLTAIASGYRAATGEALVTRDGEAVAVLVLAPATAELKGDRIDIAETVQFDTGSATIRSVSHKLLDEVAQILVAHPELQKIRIEGHTDSRGSASSNKDLSQRRADAVKQYLINAGVDANRLSAVGFGEERPLDKRETEAAWEKNRRVSFFVETRTDTKE